jgi:hypothetical protein
MIRLIRSLVNAGAKIGRPKDKGRVTPRSEQCLDGSESDRAAHKSPTCCGRSIRTWFC